MDFLENKKEFTEKELMKVKEVRIRIKSFKRMFKKYFKHLPKNLKYMTMLTTVFFGQLLTYKIPIEDLDEYVDRAVANLDRLKTEFFRIKEIYKDVSKEEM